MGLKRTPLQHNTASVKVLHDCSKVNVHGEIPGAGSRPHPGGGPVLFIPFWS
jgi:hypothetical protein